MKQLLAKLSICFAMMLVAHTAYAAQIVELSSRQGFTTVHGSLEVLEDPNGDLTIEEVSRSDLFQDAGEGVPNYGFTESVYWFRFNVANRTSDNLLILEIGYPVLDYVTLLYRKPDGGFNAVTSGDLVPFSQRAKEHRTITFASEQSQDSVREYFLRVRSSSSLQVPLRVYTEAAFAEMTRDENSILGAFYGIFFVMILFNSLLWVSLRDNTYFLYVGHLLFYLIMQCGLNGDGYRYLYRNFPSYGNILLPVAMFMGFLFALIFGRKFLLLKEYSPRFDIGFKFFEFSCVCLATASLFLPYASVIQFAAVFGLIFPVMSIVAGARVWVLGYFPAKLFVLAWCLLCGGQFIYSLKTYGIVPINSFTEYAIQIGVVFQIVLLSLALAHRIHILQEKKSASQAALLATYESLSAVLENRKLLETQNQNLQGDIQVASDQLIQADKLATLGSLAAGVAHDIANPTLLIGGGAETCEGIIEVLDKRLVALLDSESDEAQAAYRAFEGDLSKGRAAVADIKIGATRISAINESIRNQSRSDLEVSHFLVRPFLNECITILGHKCRNISLNLECLEDLEVWGRRSQVGQVITNLISNAVDASLSHVGVTGRAEVKVMAEATENGVRLGVSDNGPGIPEELRDQIIEPFFTTKGVGEGTGLGMPICVRIIEAHNSKLEIHQDSKLLGARFRFELFNIRGGEVF